MKKAHSKALWLVSGAAIVASISGGSVLAQTAPPGETSAGDQRTGGTAAVAASDIVVTGSLIRNANLNATSPLTAVTAEDFEKQDTSNIEDMLLRSPQVYGGTNSRTGFTSDAGAETLDLRNIGPNRTLILIDGHRLAPTDSNGQGAADISIIPSILIKRVDIITGGASAIYGSDALSGVVNFVLDRVDGIRMDVTGGAYQHYNGDDFVRGLQSSAGLQPADRNFFGGQHVDAAIAAGTSLLDGRAHIQAYFDYRQQDPIQKSKYDTSVCDLSGDSTGNSAVCGANSTATNSAYFQYVNNNPNANYYLDPATGGLRPIQTSDQYKGEYGNVLNGSTRYLAGFMAEYKFTDKLKAYATLNYDGNTTTTLVRPTALSFTSFTINCNNGLLTGPELTTFCGGSTVGTFSTYINRRNVEGDLRTLTNNSHQYRATMGLDADAGPFHFNLHGQYTHAESDLTYGNDYSVTRVSNAIADCVDASGAAISGCVPYNIFAPGGVTPAAVNYVQASGTFDTTVTEQIVSGTVNGDLSKYGIASPWAANGLNFALGAEYRKEAYSGRPNAELLSGDLATFGAFSALGGNNKIKEIYGELRFPVIEDRRFVKSLSIGAAGRASHYSTFGSISTFAFNAEYAPSGDVRFRGSFNRAIRAPSLEELYEQQLLGPGYLYYDGCEGPTPGYTAAQCANTGVTAAQYGRIPAAPDGLGHNTVTGGNPLLKPERANTLSAGLVFAPSFLKGFSLTADWFDIKIDGIISAPPSQNTLDECATTGNPTYCALVHRSPSNGSLWLGNDGYVFEANINGGTEHVSGVDLNTSYVVDIDRGGSLGFSLAGSYVYRKSIELIPGTPANYCQGRYGAVCGQPTPKWHHTFNVDWKSPVNIELNAAWRYTSAIETDDPVNTPAFSARIAAQSYFDLSAAYHFGKRYTLRAGANNITDKDPPLLTTENLYAGSGYNTYPSTYDILGRTLYLKLSVRI